MAIRIAAKAALNYSDWFALWMYLALENRFNTHTHSHTQRDDILIVITTQQAYLSLFFNFSLFLSPPPLNTTHTIQKLFHNTEIPNCDQDLHGSVYYPTIASHHDQGRDFIARGEEDMWVDETNIDFSILLLLFCFSLGCCCLAHWP